MLKNKKLICTSLLATSLILGSCGSNETTDNNQKTDEVQTYAQAELDEIDELILNTPFTIKNGDTIVGESIEYGDKEKNLAILKELTYYYDISNIVVYEDFENKNFNDNEDLVIGYTYLNKMILGKYTDGKVEYISLPDEELLETIYTLEGFDTYSSEVFPQELLDLFHTSYQNDSYADVYKYTVPKIAKDEVVTWTTYYNEHANNAPVNFNMGITNGYNVDFNNDGIEDILIITNEGSGYYAYEYRLQGVGDGSYVVSTDAELTEGYQFIVPIVFNDKSYIVHANDTAYNTQLSTSICYITSNGDNTNSLEVATVSNYVPSYKVLDTWASPKYEDMDDYILSRINVANIASPKAMGTAETNVEAVVTDFSEVYNVTADYNNDGKEDSVSKDFGYFMGGTISYLEILSDDTALSDTLNQLNSDTNGTKITLFLDETDYGNIVLAANGTYNRIGTINAYKITGNKVDLIGTVNFDNVNFTRIETTK